MNRHTPDEDLPQEVERQMDEVIQQVLQMSEQEIAQEYQRIFSDLDARTQIHTMAEKARQRHLERGLPCPRHVHDAQEATRSPQPASSTTRKYLFVGKRGERADFYGGLRRVAAIFYKNEKLSARLRWTAVAIALFSYPFMWVDQGWPWPSANFTSGTRKADSSFNSSRRAASKEKNRNQEIDRGNHGNTSEVNPPAQNALQNTGSGLPPDPSIQSVSSGRPPVNTLQKYGLTAFTNLNQSSKIWVNGRSGEGGGVPEANPLFLQGKMMGSTEKQKAFFESRILNSSHPSEISSPAAVFNVVHPGKTSLFSNTAMNVDHSISPDNVASADFAKTVPGSTGKTVSASNGITYHNDPVMRGNPVDVYIVWYGNWSGSGSNTAATGTLIEHFLGTISGSAPEKVSTTYGNTVSHVRFAGSTIIRNPTDFPGSSPQTQGSNVLHRGALPRDSNGVYFVQTSSGISERSEFCTKYCGFHTHATLGGEDIKYAFVGNVDSCPNCEIQSTGPNSPVVGAVGIDGMVNVISHELEEAISDPDLNAWFGTSGQENAKKCNFNVGDTSTSNANGRCSAPGATAKPKHN